MQILLNNIFMVIHLLKKHHLPKSPLHFHSFCVKFQFFEGYANKVIDQTNSDINNTVISGGTAIQVFTKYEIGNQHFEMKEVTVISSESKD